MKKLSEGMKLYGFTVKRLREVKELEASFAEMTHDKTAQECSIFWSTPFSAALKNIR